MTRRTVRLPSDGSRFFEIASFGRACPQYGRFSAAQVEHIARTVRRTPEVMVKVTGGGARTGAVLAHLKYISRQGALEIETDGGARIGSRDEQKALLNDWHLELIAGQYRQPKEGRPAPRPVKLVHNIVLSMPAPTPPDKVLAAARNFARDKFAHHDHRYALVLHTDQKHPHVHLVVKAENELGRRLHIDKQLLRTWREDFARMMREQGIAANATPRAIRGRNKRTNQDAMFRAQRHRHSTALRERVTVIANELSRTGIVHDPVRSKLLETRKAVVSNWMKTADVLDAQGEIVLAGDVRSFASHLPPVLTDNQRLATQLIRYTEIRRSAKSDVRGRDGPAGPELER